MDKSDEGDKPQEFDQKKELNKQKEERALNIVHLSLNSIVNYKFTNPCFSINSKGLHLANPISKRILVLAD